MKTTKTVKGKVRWTYETDTVDYDVLLHYEAQATCEIYEIEVLQVSECDSTLSNVARRSPTEEEKRKIAAEILDQCEQVKDKRDELYQVCFGDANRRGE